MSDEMSKLYAELHKELTGMGAREHARILRRAGIDTYTIAWLVGLSQPRALMLTNEGSAETQRQYRRQWAREKRRKEKEMSTKMQELLLAQAIRIADALEGIQQSLSLLVTKNK